MKLSKKKKDLKKLQKDLKSLKCPGLSSNHISHIQLLEAISIIKNNNTSLGLFLMEINLESINSLPKRLKILKRKEFILMMLEEDGKRNLISMKVLPKFTWTNNILTIKIKKKMKIMKKMITMKKMMMISINKLITKRNRS